MDLVFVDDDRALSVSSSAGRRGLAGTVLVHKVAGERLRIYMPGRINE